MPRTISIFAKLTVLGFALSHSSVAQQPGPSEPSSEVTIKAGERFTVVAQLLAPNPQRLQASVGYSRWSALGTTTSAPSTPSPFTPTGFSCSGAVEYGNQTFTFECSTDRNLPSGEYRSNGRVNLVRPENGESKTEVVRMPIVTLVADPFPTTQFPEVVSTSLSLSHRQSLSDGAVRAQEILDSLNAHFPTNTVNNNDTRAYLRQEVEKTKIVLDMTRKRYEAGQEGPKAQLPIFFQDFDRRLDKIAKGLGGPTSHVQTAQRYRAPHLVLAQVPKTTESVEAKDQPGTLEKHVKEFLAVLTDLIKGFHEMSDSGTTNFSWSLTTKPPGAEIWISRLGEPETKWAGLTNVKDQKLEYAIWTFRIDWNGCSKTETPDPYLQSPIAIELAKTGCKSR